jgi:hypothetical protein
MSNFYEVRYGLATKNRLHRRCKTPRGAFRSMLRLAHLLFSRPCFSDYGQVGHNGAGNVLGFWREQSDGKPQQSSQLCIWCRFSKE